MVTILVLTAGAEYTAAPQFQPRPESSAMRPLITLLLVGCSSGGPEAPAPEVEAPEASPAEHHEVADAHQHAVEVAQQREEHTHWEYKGDLGPSHWASLDVDFAVCGGGPYQSPIALQKDAASNHDDVLELHYGPTAVDVSNNGHTVQISPTAGDDHLTLNGHAYSLIQGHFHAPSEHTLNGETFPMELHLVHVDAFDHLAVLGLPIRVGEENALLKRVFDDLPAKKGDHHTLKGPPLDIGALLPENIEFLHYLGSLTTPPCAENVQWLVVETPIELAQAQVDAFSEVVGANARPLQDRHHRIVTHNGGG